MQSMRSWMLPCCKATLLLLHLQPRPLLLLLWINSTRLARHSILTRRTTRDQPTMSFFMNNAANQSVNMQNMAMAEQELEMVSDLFNRIVSSCHQKCIPKNYHEGDLNKGEAVCIDRCVSKFFEVNKTIGTKLQQMSGAGLPM